MFQITRVSFHLKSCLAWGQGRTTINRAVSVSYAFFSMTFLIVAPLFGQQFTLEVSALAILVVHRAG